MSEFQTDIESYKIDHFSDPLESEDNWTEKPVTFRNSNEDRLFGMVYSPKKLSSTRRIGILICVNAVKYRIGSFRYHTTLARDLSRIGYYVMSFDPSGIGDSEGVFDEKYLFEHYCDIQKGKYSNDIIDAVAFFKSQCKLDEIVLFGLCGGAISSLIVSVKLTEISGLILLGIPVLLDYVEGKKEKFDKASTITARKYALSLLLSMLQKLATKKTWADIFTMKVQWKDELRIFFRAIEVVIVENFNRLVFRRRERDIDVNNISKHKRYNPIFHQSMLSYFSSERKVLFVFGELDFMTWVFKSEFQDRILRPHNPYEGSYEIYVIEKANHIFSLKVNQVELSTLIKRWLKTHFSL